MRKRRSYRRGLAWSGLTQAYLLPSSILFHILLNVIRHRPEKHTAGLFSSVRAFGLIPLVSALSSAGSDTMRPGCQQCDAPLASVTSPSPSSSSQFLESLLFSGGPLRQLRKATPHVLKRFSERASGKREPAPLSAANNTDTRHPSPGRSFSSSLLLESPGLFPSLTSPPFLRPDSSCRVSVVLFPVCHPSFFFYSSFSCTPECFLLLLISTFSFASLLLL